MTSLRGFCFVRAQLAGVAVLGVILSGSGAQAADSDPWFARDKALHFDACAGIAAATYAVSAGWIVDARWKALALGGGAAMLAGAAKELADATHIFGGDPSWRDFAWDVFGAVAGLGLAWGVDLMLGGVSSVRPALAKPGTAASTGALVLHF